MMVRSPGGGRRFAEGRSDESDFLDLAEGCRKWALGVLTGCKVKLCEQARRWAVHLAHFPVFPTDDQREP